MRRPMVVANWKMYTRASDAYVLATTIRNQVAAIDGVEVVICPPSVWLSEVSDIVKKDGKVNVGAQNIFYEEEGPYTGEISPIMIRDIAKYVLVGHSERRFHFGESDIDVNEKVVAAPVERVVRAIARLREDIGRDSPILYGGSINNKDVGEFAKSPHIDGVLVGSASLRAGVFIEICKIWAEAKTF